MVPISITVNGKVRKAHVEPRTLLVHFLREQLNLTGAHVGCDTSQCGACTVLVDGRSAKSCTIFAVQADGSEVVTIEGLAKGDQLHPLQEGFWEEHGLQCGYCTPAFLMTSLALGRRGIKLEREELKEELAGVLCRCTGYQNIYKAVESYLDGVVGNGDGTE
jgi:carbon-monoxide dehydrogenase small subunit